MKRYPSIPAWALVQRLSGLVSRFGNTDFPNSGIFVLNYHTDRHRMLTSETPDALLESFCATPDNGAQQAPPNTDNGVLDKLQDHFLRFVRERICIILTVQELVNCKEILAANDPNDRKKFWPVSYNGQHYVIIFVKLWTTWLNLLAACRDRHIEVQSCWARYGRIRGVKRHHNTTRVSLLRELPSHDVPHVPTDHGLPDYIAVISSEQAWLGRCIFQLWAETYSMNRHRGIRLQHGFDVHVLPSKVIWFGPPATHVDPPSSTDLSQSFHLPATSLSQEQINELVQNVHAAIEEARKEAQRRREIRAGAAESKHTSPTDDEGMDEEEDVDDSDLSDDPSEVDDSEEVDEEEVSEK